ncbi:interleukin-12 receptor subunit beta-2 isoform X2 [Cheilinus undulatus]|uniref:interleukin-12 receptor subunit beta-2 isoform X2 n=1 Tax=Cheilinus undulatus TaxID=241271 RepID=UPI001BD341D5|nr:interleukin-12 receptor subunit beta-2 isoform X2 [Cheilinus undulatus]
MATMSRAWSILAAVMAMQLCTGLKSCSISSSAGRVVHRGSTFRVYCTFQCESKRSTERSIRSYPPSTKRDYAVLNSTTIYHEVVNITEERTFSCEDPCHPAKEPCGMDIEAGYPPEKPKNISCILNVTNNKTGIVKCTREKGRNTFVRNTSVLWEISVFENHTAAPVLHSISSKGSVSQSASISVSSSARKISVWVKIENVLGSAESIPLNYTLTDIAMPLAPVLGQPECFSRMCIVKVEQSVRTRYIEIQYTADTQTWTSTLNSMSQVQVQPLEPFRLYYFTARSRFNTGHWSPWSTNTSGWTQEEAPAKELDVWYIEDPSDNNSLRLYWKKPSVSIARGKIIQYKVSVYSQKAQTLIFTTNMSAEAWNYKVPFCADCEVKVWAYNSKGPSPPARITTRHRKAKPPQDVHFSANNQSVAISWGKLETASLHADIVVEWYPEGNKQEDLRWARLGRNNHLVITVPAAGPSVQEKVDGNKVKVTWMEIPRGQRGGCIRNYSIYLENSNGHLQRYSVPASEKTYTVQGLSPDTHSLWMTASTDKGEGPAGQKVKFFIEEEAPLSLLLVCLVILLFVLFLICLWQCPAVKQRFCGLFECLMLEAVLDPANSKWAKECTQEKGKINLQLPRSPCSITEEEEEPILVDVEELPNLSSETCSSPVDSTQLSSETGLTPLMEQTTLHYPLTTYIKSLSHDSDTSDKTETSLDTNSTIDYISSHGLGEIDEEDQEEEEFPQTMGFFSSHNIFMGSLEFGGKLTLDAVKIDCTDFFQNM